MTTWPWLSEGARLALVSTGLGLADYGGRNRGATMPGQKFRATGPFTPKLTYFNSHYFYNARSNKI